MSERPAAPRSAPSPNARELRRPVGFGAVGQDFDVYSATGEPLGSVSQARSGIWCAASCYVSGSAGIRWGFASAREAADALPEDPERTAAIRRVLATLQEVADTNDARREENFRTAFRQAIAPEGAWFRPGETPAERVRRVG